MKTGWQYATRKDKLESIAFKSDGMTNEQKIIAWERLMEKFKELSDLNGARLPRFKDILLCVVSAQSKAKAIHLAAVTHLRRAEPCTRKRAAVILGKHCLNSQETCRSGTLRS